MFSTSRFNSSLLLLLTMAVTAGGCRKDSSTDAAQPPPVTGSPTQSLRMITPPKSELLLARLVIVGDHLSVLVDAREKKASNLNYFESNVLTHSTNALRYLHSFQPRKIKDYDKIDEALRRIVKGLTTREEFDARKEIETLRAFAQQRDKQN
jgi:hypothetical protein